MIFLRSLVESLLLKEAKLDKCFINTTDRKPNRSTLVVKNMVFRVKDLV